MGFYLTFTIILSVLACYNAYMIFVGNRDILYDDYCTTDEIGKNIYKVFSLEDMNCRKISLDYSDICWRKYDSFGNCELILDKPSVIKMKELQMRKSVESMIWLLLSLWIMLTYVKYNRQVLVRVEKYC